MSDRYVVERIRLIKKGAAVTVNRPHMDRKVRRCYPRGSAYFKMVYMNTIEYLLSH